MATNRTSQVLAPLIRALRGREADDKTDGQLLEQFVSQRDESAFAALVRRHGPMILGVCRRILGNDADAEDAFQATFIVLVRKTTWLRGRPVLGDWLHGVARCTALKARGAAVRRRVKEQATGYLEAPANEARNDWLPLLDEAVSKLPEKYRLPIVLCDLEGHTRGQAAEQLGWPEGTVAGRLARGRELLAKRLLRGALVAVPAALAASVTNATIAADLANTTVQTASCVAASGGTGVTSAKALMLAQGVMNTMFWNQIKTGVLAIILAVVTVGAGGWTIHGLAETPMPHHEHGARVTTPAIQKDPVVHARELDLKGFQPQPPILDFGDPVTIAHAQDLAKIIPDKTWQEKIAKQTDFAKEQLVYFAWAGSGQDKLTSKVSGKDGLVVVFQYRQGQTLNDQIHFHFYAIAKNARLRVERFDQNGKAVAATTPVIRKLDLSGLNATRVLDLSWFTPAQTFGKALTPTPMTSAKELAKVIPDKTWQEHIAKQIDFAKEQLVFFTWKGSGGDKLICKIEEGQERPVAVIQYSAGETEDEVRHSYLYAVARNALWRVEQIDENGKVLPARERPALP